MLRDTRKFTIGEQTLTAFLVAGPEDLRSWFNELNKKPVEKFKEKKFFSGLFKTAENVSSEQLTLYKNNLQTSLILVSNGFYYFYDLLKGAAASNDVKDVFGDKLVDVSGMESRQNLEKTNYDVGKARELSAEHLRDFETAVQYAYKQIKATQKSAQPKPVSPGMSGGRSIGG